jgi:hypothetical protein
LKENINLIKMKNFIDTLIESNQIEINNSEKNKNFLRQAYIY